MKLNGYFKEFIDFYEKYKSDLIEHSDLITERKKLLDFLKKSTTFKTEELVKFLLKYISLNEQRKYISLECVCTNKSQKSKKSKSFILILSEEDYLDTIKMPFISIKDRLDDFNYPYIKLKYQDEYRLCNIPEFDQFPYFNGLANRIIIEKLKNPDEKNINILNGELNKTKLAYRMFNSIDNQKNNKKTMSLNLTKK